MKLRSKTTLALGVLLLAGAGAFVYTQSQEARTQAERYKTQAAERGDLTQNVSANGTLNPVKVVSVGTQVSGTVRKLYVDYNSRVTEGQVLAELDQALLSATARQSAANALSAKASLDLAIANEQRLKTLFAQEYVSKQDYDTAVQTRKSAEATAASARASADKDAVNLGNTVIRAPVSGVVTDKQVDVGQTVAASLQTPTLMKIAQDLSKMQIDSAFAEADVGMVREGQAVRFNVDAFPNQAFHGVVKQIRLNPTTTSNVVTYDVVISVDNPGEKLLPGMTAYVNIAVAERKDVLLVPNAALRFKPADGAVGKTAAGSEKSGDKKDERSGEKRRRDASSKTVYVFENGQLKPVAITVGITDNRNTEVVGGDLKPGMQVVVADMKATGATNGKSGAPSGPPRMF
jgi:HlyD family secretion protein